MPPILVRLLARYPHGRPFSDAEISERSGLNPIQVHAVSQCVTWEGVDVPTARKFLVGCGVDFCNRSDMKRIDTYVRKKPTWKYLRTSPDWKTVYEPMMKRWKETYAPNRN